MHGRNRLLFLAVLAAICLAGCMPTPSVLSVTNLTAEPSRVAPGGRSSITATISNPGGKVLTYTWSATDGTFEGEGSTVTWVAPTCSGEFTVTLVVADTDANSATSDVALSVFG